MDWAGLVGGIIIVVGGITFILMYYNYLERKSKEVFDEEDGLTPVYENFVGGSVGPDYSRQRSSNIRLSLYPEFMVVKYIKGALLRYDEFSFEEKKNFLGITHSIIIYHEREDIPKSIELDMPPGDAEKVSALLKARIEAEKNASDKTDEDEDDDKNKIAKETE